MTPDASGVAGGPAGLLYALRLLPSRWDTIDTSTPGRGLATVAGGWFLLAFGRFGIPALTAPRPVVRFVLVGIYVWLAMAALVWLVARLARPARIGLGTPDATRSLQFIGLAHQPLVVLGIVLQVGQLLPTQRPSTIAAALTLLIWLPGLLLAAIGSAFGRLDRWSVAAAVVTYLLWAGLAGRYLLDRVGHLF